MSVRTARLASGLQVATHAMAEVETVSLGIFVEAGSRHEAREEHGISHLLEHMAFKGTRRRSARRIAEEIESVGGELNAATNVDHTAFYARVLREDFDLGLDILADIATDGVLDEDELAREKNVILQEIAAAEDAPEDLVFDLFQAAAFPGQSIGRSILGDSGALARLSRNDLASYLRRHYRAPSIVVAAAGAVSHERLLEGVAERFAGLGAETAAAPAPARYIGGETIISRKLEQTHVVVGFEGVSYDHDAAYAAQIFANAVGGGMSSRLFQNIREERGLAYSIYSFHWSYADTGLFGFYAGTGHDDVGETIAASLETLGEAVEALSEDEARRAKAQTKVSLLTALESSSARTDQIARQLAIFGRVLPREEIIGRIDALTVSEIRAAGGRLLASTPTIAVIGSTKQAPGSAEIAARLGRS